MNPQVLNIVTLIASFLTVFCSAEFFYHKFSIKVEWSRKYVHLFAGLITLLFPVMLGSHWLVLMLSAGFAIVLLFSKKFNLLQSIHNIERKSKGAVLYPLSIYLCFLFYDLYGMGLYFYLPVLIMAISDPLAAVFGKKFPKGRYTIGSAKKTLVGSSAFLTSSLIISIICLNLLTSLSFYPILFIALIIAGLTTAIEAVSGNGLDNITIPAGALFILAAIEYCGYFV